jgi:hypothetical protein
MAQFIPVVFDEQIPPDTIERALCGIIDHLVNPSALNARHKNDATGAPGGPAEKR